MQRNFEGPPQANLSDPDVGPVLQMLSLRPRSGCEIMLYRHVQAGLTHISTCPGAVAFRSFTLAAVNDCAGAAFSGPWCPSLNPARRFLAVRLGLCCQTSPARAQTEALQDRDRYECYRWAVRETSTDPGITPVRSAPVRLVKAAPMAATHWAAQPPGPCWVQQSRRRPTPARMRCWVPSLLPLWVLRRAERATAISMPLIHDSWPRWPVPMRRRTASVAPCRPACRAAAFPSSEQCIEVPHVGFPAQQHDRVRAIHSLRFAIGSPAVPGRPAYGCG